MTEVSKDWKILTKKVYKSRKGLPNWLFSVLENRGIKNEQEISSFLNPVYEKIISPNNFENMALAVNKISEAIKNKMPIAIYGDYDVDGITATALIFEALNKIGVHRLETYIPHREEEGYGLNPEALKELEKKGVKLVIAVDCGITSSELIDSNKFKKIDFIVCDHHEIDKNRLPKRSINIHPGLTLKGTKQQNLSACGVVFFLARALQLKFIDVYPSGQEKWLLDLVALATICDVVPLTDQNRILTKYGLKVLAKTKRPGITELMKTASISPDDINAYAVGFLLGPRLNAAGRLEHAKKALELLLTDDPQKAQTIAENLAQLNSDRQKMCERILEEAKAEIEQSKSKNHEIYLLSNKNWPRGVVGIIAGRLAENYSRPVIVFEHNGETHHGSARSIDGFDIAAALGEVSDCLLKYGGHAKAAGVTVSDDKFIIFKDKLLEVTRNKIKSTELCKELTIDCVIDISEINDVMLKLLSTLEPFGYGNHTPTFAILGAELENFKKVGQKNEHLKFNIKAISNKESVRSGDKKPKTYNLQPTLNAIWFNYDHEVISSKPTAQSSKQKYDLAFSLRYNIWNDKKSIEMRILSVRKSLK